MTHSNPSRAAVVLCTMAFVVLTACADDSGAARDVLDAPSATPGTQAPADAGASSRDTVSADGLPLAPTASESLPSAPTEAPELPTGLKPMPAPSDDPSDANTATCEGWRLVDDLDTGHVTFAVNSAKLTPAARATVDELARLIIRRSPGTAPDVHVVGHTDTRPLPLRDGSDGNQQLSVDRAAVVRTALIDGGVDPARLAPPEGRGASEPVDTGDSEEAHARNRRVEVTVDCPAGGDALSNTAAPAP